MSGGTLGAGPPSPWCAWCGDGSPWPFWLTASLTIQFASAPGGRSSPTPKTETLPTQRLRVTDRDRGRPGRRITYGA